MHWLIQHWQTIAALGVVGITAAVFIRRMLHRDQTSCGGSCECPTKKMARRTEIPEAPGNRD